jgi:hypothetical protein
MALAFTDHIQTGLDEGVRERYLVLSLNGGIHNAIFL